MILTLTSLKKNIFDPINSSDLFSFFDFKNSFPHRKTFILIETSFLFYFGHRIFMPIQILRPENSKTA
jgi:hypothetical protein